MNGSSKSKENVPDVKPSREVDGKKNQSRRGGEKNPSGGLCPGFDRVVVGIRLVFLVFCIHSLRLRFFSNVAER